MLSIVIPAYNEQNRIERTLRETCAYFHARPTSTEILVVSDGSRDNTSAVVQTFIQTGEQSPSPVRVRLLSYDANRGKGYAVRFGVLRAEGDRVLFMDADLATPIAEIEKLEAALHPSSGVEIAIGSRPLRDSQLLVRQPWYREWAGRGFNKAVQLAATPGIADTQCGFKLFTRRAVREIFSRCVLDGFSFDVEALFLARRLGFRVAEVPVRWAHQEGAAAFPNARAYLRHGLKMVGDLVRIRRVHRTVRPDSLRVIAAASNSLGPPSA